MTSAQNPPEIALEASDIDGRLSALSGARDGHQDADGAADSN
ncbi:hypothetical protein ACH9L7_20210 (plasmid) [Haloferax sp. S1W]